MVPRSFNLPGVAPDPTPLCLYPRLALLSVPVMYLNKWQLQLAVCGSSLSCLGTDIVNHVLTMPHMTPHAGNTPADTITTVGLGSCSLPCGVYRGRLEGVYKLFKAGPGH